MARLALDIRGALLKSGREEFLAHGFEKASLRAICKKAGLTTGAFYSHFSGKEELFDALVKPMIDGFFRLYEAVIAEELSDLTTGVDNELTSITYAVRHRDEFRLLFECSAGTKYEGFRERLINEVFYPGYQAVFDRYAGRDAGNPVDPALVRLILRMKFEEYMELIYGGYSMEEIKRLIVSHGSGRPLPLSGRRDHNPLLHAGRASRDGGRGTGRAGTAVHRSCLPSEKSPHRRDPPGRAGGSRDGGPLVQSGEPSDSGHRPPADPGAQHRRHDRGQRLGKIHPDRIPLRRHSVERKRGL